MSEQAMPELPVRMNMEAYIGLLGEAAQLRAKVAELIEERDWLAREYQKATGNAYFPGKVLRFNADGGPFPGVPKQVLP